MVDKPDLVLYSHIEAFERALRLDEYHFDHPNGLSSPSTSAAPVTGSSRIHKVSASSDFAPIHSRVDRYDCITLCILFKGSLFHVNLLVDRGNKKHKRHDWSYLIFRWPLLVSIPVVLPLHLMTHYLIVQIFIFLFIAAEFNLYVLVRQLVNGKEWITACERSGSVIENHECDVIRQGEEKKATCARNCELREPMR